VGGKWSDDGNGCPFIGRPVSPNGSFNPNSTGEYQITTWIGNYDLPLYGYLGQGAAIVQAVGQQLNSSLSVGVLVEAPVARTGVGPVQVSTSLVTQYDSGSGASESLAVGASYVGGGFAATVEHEESMTDEKSDTRIFAGIEKGGLEAGGFMSPTSGTFGAYAGYGGWVAGVYFSMGGGGGGPVDYSSCGFDKDCLSAMTEPMKVN
jgi:hypothetical protein